MMDPRKQILVMNLMLAGLLLGYTAMFVGKFVWALAVLVGQSF